MTLLTTHQIHVLCCQGRFYNGSDAIIDYAYLTRYLEYCDRLEVLVRTRHVAQVDASLPRLDGDRVTIVPLPDPRSPLTALMTLPTLLRGIYRAIQRSQACYLKMPDVLGTLAGVLLLCLQRPYAVEVVADSYEGIRHAKASMFGCEWYARVFDRLTRWIVSRASTVTYISRYLQRRYPHGTSDRQYVFCSVAIADEDRGQPRTPEAFDVTPFRLVAAGRLSGEKGHVYLIRAMRRIIDMADRRVTLDILGEGPERPALDAEIKTLGLQEHVRLLGYVKRGAPLHRVLDAAQLYVLPSLTEGMGRGLIEAMARGVPCVATAVGGVPEYLDQDCLVEPADPEALAFKILSVMNQAETLACWSQRNVTATQAFSPEGLRAVKMQFWSMVQPQSQPV
ncbi:MAG: glycosyltransferase [Phycisphaerae bacterium]|nr:glycosyltransferase [Phycisphaerae bacterium]